MPTYKNTSGSSKNFQGSTVEAGAYVGSPHYVDLDGYSDFEFVKHTPYARIPQKLFAKAPDDSTIEGIEDYSGLLIKNGSGQNLTIIFNSNSSHEMVFLPGEILFIDCLNRCYSTAKVSGTGTDSAFIYGILPDSAKC